MLSDGLGATVLAGSSGFRRSLALLAFASAGLLGACKERDVPGALLFNERPTATGPPMQGRVSNPTTVGWPCRLHGELAGHDLSRSVSRRRRRGQGLQPGQAARLATKGAFGTPHFPPGSTWDGPAKSGGNVLPR
jgi:hypothetical protein